MYVGKISPVVSGNYKLNKVQSTRNVSTNVISNNGYMSKDMANAYKAQVSFGSTGIIQGQVEGKPSVSATLNGKNRIPGNFEFSNVVDFKKSLSKYGNFADWPLLGLDVVI